MDQLPFSSLKYHRMQLFWHLVLRFCTFIPHDKIWTGTNLLEQCNHPNRFVVVNGIPSIGVFTMVGTGNIEKQPMSLASVLPASLNLASNSTSPVTASGTPGGATVAASASAPSNTVTAAAAAARSRATRSQRNTATLMSIAGFFTLATLLRWLHRYSFCVWGNQDGHEKKGSRAIFI